MSSTKSQNTRKAELQAAAELNGFETWSGMNTFIKNTGEPCIVRDVDQLAEMIANSATALPMKEQEILIIAQIIRAHMKGE